MPLYEYQCKKCGHVTVFLEKSDAKGPHKCEKCGSTQTEKIFSSFAVGQSSSGSSSSSSCSTGTCSTGTCPTGTCPFS